MLLLNHVTECHHVIGGKSKQSHPYTVIAEKYQQYKQEKDASDPLPRVMGLTASPIKSSVSSTFQIMQKARTLEQRLSATVVRVENDELKEVVSKPTILFYPYVPQRDELDVAVTVFEVPIKFKEMLEKYYKLLNQLDIIISESGYYGAAVAMRILHRRLSEKDEKDLVADPYKEIESTQEYQQWLEQKVQWMQWLKIFVKARVNHFDEALHNEYSDEKWQYDADINMKLDSLIKFINDSHRCIKGVIVEGEGAPNERSGVNQRAQQHEGALEERANSEFNASVFNNPDSMKQQGIIFVAQRMLGYVLQSILSLRFKDLKFGIMTGHNCQLFGMDDKEQCRVVRRFRNRDIDYLIATSVAEEGIDIQSCNCVVMYRQPDTVKSYIQCRGRARNKASKFVLFVNTESDSDRSKIQDFQKHEQVSYTHTHLKCSVSFREQCHFQFNIHHILIHRT